MSTLSNGRRTPSRSVLCELPPPVTGVITEYAVGTVNELDASGVETGHQLIAATVARTTSASPSSTSRRRRRRGAAGWPLLGGRGGALTLAPWPSVLIITSSVQAVLGTSG